MGFEHSKLIRVDEDDYNELKKIKDITGIPIIKLIEFSIPLLKKKYKIKDEPKINDVIEGQIELRCDNGDSKL